MRHSDLINRLMILQHTLIYKWNMVQLPRSMNLTNSPKPSSSLLPGISVSSGGNYTDENGQQWVTDEVDLAKGVYIKRIEKIASYNNESINGPYISETGELTVGARVLFALDASVEAPLSPETIVAYKQLHTYAPTTTIINDGGAGMEVAYIADTKAYIDGKIAEISAAIVSK